MSYLKHVKSTIHSPLSKRYPFSKPTTLGQSTLDIDSNLSSKMSVNNLSEKSDSIVCRKRSFEDDDCTNSTSCMNPTNSNHDKSSVSRVFTVVYGKPSTKKHKSWEFDGKVELKNNSAYLKDSSGKIIETKHKLSDADQYENGYETYIGGKSVQIQDEIKSADSSLGLINPPTSQEPNNTKVPWKPLLKRNKLVSSVIKPPEQKSSLAPKSSNDTFCSQSKHEEKTPDNICTNSPRVFTVVYGKPSTKKHKSWEFDGTVELKNNSAYLKDSSGKVIETKHKLSDADQYDSGYETYIGGKSVQIQDEIKLPNSLLALVDHPTKQEPSDSKVPWKPPVKRSKLSGHVIKHPEVEPLILPKPSVDHLWNHNPNLNKTADVQVENFLTRVLKPHQREGVSFLYERLCDLKNYGQEGAILADEMGLGKTLQCIALIWTLLRQGPYGRPVIKSVLIVTPSSLTSNWNDEFKKWLGTHRLVPYHIEKNKKVEDYSYSKLSPVMIISYDMLIRSIDALSNINFDLLICDEGHRLKNGKSKLYSIMNSLKIKKRIVLTGTPLQNDLQEFFFLIDFVTPGVLDSLRDFKKNFEQPIVESKAPHCSSSKKSLGQMKSAQLHRRTNYFILRRTSEVNIQFLSTKNEYVVICKPTLVQQRLYETAVDYWMNRTSALSHLGVTHALRKICNHPGLIMQSDENEDLSDNLSDENEDLSDKLRDSKDLTSYLSQEWLSLTNNVYTTDQSSKLLLVENLISELHEKDQEKIVIVSYFTLTLDIIEVLCKENSYDYLRLDGSTGVQARKSIVDQFNDLKSKYFVLLLSARAGGCGLNLIGASRLVLYDSDWNPATDLQAMARIWRHGQQKAVHIYRLLTAGTVEEKIFQRQIRKADLTQSVINKDQHHFNDVGVKMSIEELRDLFTFDEHTDSTIHSSLQCDCSCAGEIPNLCQKEDENPTSEFEEEEDDDFPLECFQKKKDKIDEGKKIKNKEHMLMSWSHFSGPNLTREFLEELGFQEGIVSFLFTHRT